MRIRVLGCSGGIGGSLRTTAFLVDDDILVDAGTGVGDLPLESLAKIDHIFVSHSHLDHVASIPFLVDTVCWMRGSPIVVYGIKDTLDILRAHLFNWKVWPDFTQIPDGDNPFMVYREIAVGQTVEIGGRRLTALPANHTVPAVGYLLDSGRASLAYSGDTTVNEGLWKAVNEAANLRYLIIETAFSNKEREIAVASKHLCPDMLARELARMRSRPEVFITHLKPGEGALTMKEISEAAGRWRPRMLENHQEFTL
ncbi:MAG: 3',5'-cyclic-nucleotide phosphodiesterase [Betaproteobacteria bacterium]|nr:3',5'-cyclic-nucleotide phosphodiesterase [Burkholderiales bacterium]NJD88173.1 3',5'-cyclic-nucleotide phosphodiesterase [Betaproteobacteria bacterium]PWB66346.1 MAG: 3',5'-cyclic-nucleotide phosphodiesterase [Betaproteobacteria bacterium]